jgi:hypothetical protein
MRPAIPEHPAYLQSRQFFDAGDRWHHSRANPRIREKNLARYKTHKNRRNSRQKNTTTKDKSMKTNDEIIKELQNTFADLQYRQQHDHELIVMQQEAIRMLGDVCRGYQKTLEAMPKPVESASPAVPFSVN